MYNFKTLQTRQQHYADQQECVFIAHSKSNVASRRGRLFFNVDESHCTDISLSEMSQQ